MFSARPVTLMASRRSPTTSRWRVPLALFLALGLLAPAALADDGVEPPKGPAWEHFWVGNELYKKGQFVEAEAEYQAAWDEKSHFDIAASLGATELRIGQVREAAAHLAYADVNFPMSGDPDKHATIQRLRAEAEAQVGRVTLRSMPPAATLLVDGVPVSEVLARLPLCVEAGTRTVEVRADGYVSKRLEISVEKGQVLILDAPLEREVNVLRPPVEEESALIPMIVGGTALAALVVGVVATVVSNGASDEVADLQARVDASQMRCGAGADPATCADLVARLQTTDTTHDIAVAGFVAAGALGLVAGGLVLWPRDDSSAKEPTAVLRPALGGLTVGGTF